MTSFDAARARLCDPEAEVSAHYLIAEDGRCDQLVPEGARAWHAGAGRWGGVCDVNSHSIGIELANRGDHPFPEPQMVALEHLLGGIMNRWQIAPEGVIGHSDMAPLRKADPGSRFDWRRLARRGLAVWASADPSLADVSFVPSAVRFGYDGSFASDVLLGAFRLRFRPWITGPECPEDRALMATLAAHYPATV